MLTQSGGSTACAEALVELMDAINAFALMSQGNQKVQTDFVGYFVNAALSNAKNLADVRDNVNAIMKQFGVSDEALSKTIVSAAKSGQLDSGTASAWLNGIKERRELPEVEKPLGD